jgi:SAM-dependent methyltransferase
MNPADLPLPARTPASDRAWQGLVERASAPYRGVGRFAYHFARGKLGRDPVFRGLLERGDLRGELRGELRSDKRGDLRDGSAGDPAGARVIDIGCGQGLLASLLQACADAAAAGAAGAAGHPADAAPWPADWPPPPRARSYLGVELMPHDVARAARALAGSALAPRFVCADMRAAALPSCDLVVILDVLHYVDHADQAALLARVRDALAPPPGGGRLLLRVGDASDRGGFAASQWVDRIVAWSRGHRVPPTWGRPLAEWSSLLRGLGFRVRPVPMSQGTPFANVLLVADLDGARAGDR